MWRRKHSACSTRHALGFAYTGEEGMISSSVPIVADPEGIPAVGGRQEEQSGRRSNVETENKDQEPETASATLADGMHFVGNIEGFRWDLDAEEDTGGVGAGPQPHRLLLLAMAGCTAM